MSKKKPTSKEEPKSKEALEMEKINQAYVKMRDILEDELLDLSGVEFYGKILGLVYGLVEIYGYDSIKEVTRVYKEIYCTDVKHKKGKK